MNIPHDNAPPEMNKPHAGGGRVVALVSDLIFATKVTATARFVGVDAAAHTSAANAHAAVKNATAVIVDMHLPGDTPDQFIRSLRAEHPHMPIIAFYSHVCTELAERARAAGASDVLPRSKFSRDLGAILTRCANPDVSQEM